MTRRVVERTATGPRGLTQVVGAAMAAVAAGSLIMFSLLAEKVVEPRSRGVAVQPRVPRDVDAERSLTVPPPPPEQVGGTPPSESATTLLISATVVEPAAPIAPSLPELRDPDGTRVVVAEVDVVPRPGLIGLRVPKNTVTAYVGPSARGDDCPGRPQKPRSPGTHPHGGPPACGNPHGEPPGQTRNHGGAAPASQGHSGDTNGSPSDRSNGHGNPHETPPGHSHDAPSHDDSGGDGSSAPPENPPGEHPHGAPPGQTKESSSESSGSSSSGHPHGGPPGQEKKKG
ncbi:MAG: hypothetical protein M3285_00210 [Actinomycetota bacterium]|nr:hypothetical protein [Actinomycetota bacterium]